MWWCAESPGRDVGGISFGLTLNSLCCGRWWAARPFPWLALVNQRAALLQVCFSLHGGRAGSWGASLSRRAGAVPGTLGSWWHSRSVSTGLIFLQGEGSWCQKTAVLPAHLWCECVCTHQQGVTEYQGQTTPWQITDLIKIISQSSGVKAWPSQEALPGR